MAQNNGGMSPSTQTAHTLGDLTDDYGPAREAWSKDADESVAGVTLQKLHPIKTRWDQVDVLAKSGDPNARVWLIDYASDILIAGHAVFSNKDDMLAFKRDELDKLIALEADSAWAGTNLLPLILRQQMFIGPEHARLCLSQLASQAQIPEVAAAARYASMEILASLKSRGKYRSDSRAHADEMKAIEQEILREYPSTRTVRAMRIKLEPRAYYEKGSPHDFDAADDCGNAFALTSYLGAPLLLCFQCDGCGPNDAVVNDFVTGLHERYSALGLNLVSVHERFHNRKNHPLVAGSSEESWRHIRQPAQVFDICRQFNVRAFPVTFLIDTDGVILRRWEGLPRWAGLSQSQAELEADIARSLGQARRAKPKHTVVEGRRAQAAGHFAWAETLQEAPTESDIRDLDYRRRITETELPWRVRDRSTGIEMLLVPAGEFKRIAAPGALRYQSDSAVAQSVSIEAPFYLGRYEVTEAQWAHIMQKQNVSIDTDLPVHGVSFTEVCAFLSAANGMSYNPDLPRGLRLPAEVEWEYACRAGNEGVCNAPIASIAWGAGNAVEAPQRIGTKSSNAWGFYDLLGNVDEWCNDRFVGTLMRHPDEKSNRDWNPAQDARFPLGDNRIQVGGSWRFVSCESYRGYAHPHARFQSSGFRVARTL